MRNGAGKTTTMRAIFGLTSLDADSVRWNGAPVTQAERQDQVQALAFPLSLPVIFGYIMAITTATSGSPATFFEVLAYLPPTAPFAMPVLAGLGAVSWWQFAVAAGISASSAPPTSPGPPPAGPAPGGANRVRRPVTPRNIPRAA